MSNAKKQARQDAIEYARAEMYFGEGAGTRRKLIGNTVTYRAENNEEYDRAFRQAMAEQDWADHSKKAKAERRRRDGAQAVEKNVRNLANKNYGNVNTGVLIFVGIGYVAHKTGYDKKLLEMSKVQYRKLKRRIDASRGKSNVHNIRS